MKSLLDLGRNKSMHYFLLRFFAQWIIYILHIFLYLCAVTVIVFRQCIIIIPKYISTVRLGIKKVWMGFVFSNLVSDFELKAENKAEERIWQWHFYIIYTSILICCLLFFNDSISRQFVWGRRRQWRTTRPASGVSVEINGRGRDPCLSGRGRLTHHTSATWCVSRIKHPVYSYIC